MGCGDSESPSDWEALSPADAHAIDEAFNSRRIGDETTVIHERGLHLKLCAIDEDPKNMKVKYRGGEAVCIRPGCKRLAQNGKPGDFCGQVCRNKGPCVCPLRRMGKNGEAQTHPPTMD